MFDIKAYDPDRGINNNITYTLLKINYGVNTLMDPFIKVDSETGAVSTSVDIDREKYDVSNYFEVIKSLCKALMINLNSSKAIL